jgi:nucleoid-associated protein YgaU
VRLTRRGVVVVALAVALLAGVLVWLARLSAPQAATPRPAVHVVVVQPGDTLWGIATRVAPGGDPQAEVERLMRRNHLTDPGQLRPGMQLRVR